jgi:hypothetical protein
VGEGLPGQEVRVRLSALLVLQSAGSLLASPPDFFTANLGLEAEWLRDTYIERIAFDQAGPLANFNANRYGIFVHWRP